MENLLPIVYLVAFVTTVFFLFRANYIQFLRFAFVPIALGAATVLQVLEKSYPSITNMATIGLASGALLFLLVQLFIVLVKLFSQKEPKAILAKVAFNKEYE